MAAFQAGLLRPRMGRFIRTARQPRVLWFANRAFALLERVSRHKIAMCLLVMAVSLTLRLALLRSRPIPQPFVTDEYSYLLGAETFASGRLTNPMHPMWEHFETLHELVRPSYMSKYPPGQAHFLALGWKLLGHPWYGVWLSFGLFSACLCWMLQNWVPPSYALLGTAIMLARISILGYWMNSYWGGAVAAAAGCLLFGALPRLARGRVKSTDVILASIALILLANTRPYEGLLLSAAAFLALLYWRRKGPRSLKELISPRCVVPLLLICGAAAALDGYYNYRVTGRALQMPYNAYFQQYQIASPWLIFREQNPPAYRHVDIENTWKEQDSEYREKKASLHVNLNDVKNVALSSSHRCTFFRFPSHVVVFKLPSMDCSRHSGLRVVWPLHRKHKGSSLCRGKRWVSTALSRLWAEVDESNRTRVWSGPCANAGSSSMPTRQGDRKGTIVGDQVRGHQVTTHAGDERGDDGTWAAVDSGSVLSSSRG